MKKINWTSKKEKEQQETIEKEQRNQQEAIADFIKYAVNKAVLEGELSEEQKNHFLNAFDPWIPGQTYAVGEKKRHNGKIYEIIQAHTSQTGWEPEKVPALFKIFAQTTTTEPGGGDPVEVIPNWKQPTGAHDSYKKGTKVNHNGKVFISEAEGNVWEPGQYGWKEVDKL